MLPKLLGVRDENDDWTGISSPQERRRRQNRLHQRAHRNKIHRRRLEIATTLATSSDMENDDAVTLVTRRPSKQEVQVINAVKQLPIAYLLDPMGASEKAFEFLQNALTHWNLSQPIARDLSTLSRLNSFDALARNALILQIPVELLGSDDGESLFFRQPFELDVRPSRNYPTHLAPTALQRTVRHHPWLDLFPFPRMRDNILRGLQAATLDEDQLVDEFVCDLLNFTAIDTASLMIWGDSWDQNAWEFRPDFLKKWAFLMQGCEDVLQGTNHWRVQREAEQLEDLFN